MKVEQLNSKYNKPDYFEFFGDLDLQEMRAEEEAEGKRILSGYAAVFDQETEIAGLFREVIRSGAFKKTLREGDQVALWNHESGKPLARKSKKTLNLKEDEKGLRFSIKLGNTTWEKDAYEAVRSGNVNGMSFGFQVVKSKWHFIGSDEDKNQLDLREITEVKLFEVSPVTFPAYPTTDVDARALLPVREDIQQTDTTQEPDAGNHSRVEREPEPDDHSRAGLKAKQRLQKQSEMEICLKWTQTN